MPEAAGDALAEVPARPLESEQPVRRAADLVRDNLELLSLPEVCLRIQQMADDPDCMPAEFGELVAQDAALSARLLRLVNSAFYGFPARIDTLSRALQLVGIEALRSLALASSAAEVFERLPLARVTLVEFWRHSLFCGLLARALARRASVLHCERLFIGGLLHDIGQLLLCSRLPETMGAVLAEIEHGMEVIDAEREQLGFDHAELGAELLLAWQLPLTLREAVRFHHQPELAPPPGLEAALLQVADAATGELERLEASCARPHYDPYDAFLNPEPLNDGRPTPLLDRIRPSCWAQARLDRGMLDGAIREAAHAFDDTLTTLFGI
ncbi:HDOD domain-containing protein [Thiohalobacter sp. IOR34]|uniref:HDOD domain-containing protein n=1 Tax=Thiohalobacter sp. IOR34 TaxID=3057176 RepID=UPI0025B13313|nr:HDOD domain-containing protein [Thiohalobacter sp. IOR34]WJW75416.1 HDOD domain-containing protein [Thiohalobacter sp. IOR34]